MSNLNQERPVAAQRLDRRIFLKQAAALSGLAMAGVMGFAASARAMFTVSQPPLPYPQSALEPYISARTIEFHYGKHHNGYVRKTNNLLKSCATDFKDLEAVVAGTKNVKGKEALYNNASQVWNHNFYWPSMKPGGGGEPKGALREGIEASFGSYAKFKDAFTAKALGQFGSGWAWLVLDGGKLDVEATSNAFSPLPDQKPLLVCDVWEHAYYLDYQNRRAKYVENFLNHLVNWEFAEKNYAAGMGKS